MAPTTYATLYTGAKMPLIGYGTWQARQGEIEEPFQEALRAGYRHIDTAAAYNNEGIIGQILDEDWIKKGKLKREDLFIVTKLPVSGIRPEGPEKWMKRSLQKLRTNYVDLYLIHMPYATKEEGEDTVVLKDGKLVLEPETDHLAVWKAMEALVDAGHAKAIGVSNFNKRQIQNILDNCRIKPAVNQVELHVYMQHRELVDYCTKNGIVVTAYSPVGSPNSGPFVERFTGEKFHMPDLLHNPTVLEVAKKHNKTAGQILLKHIVQRGIVAIPKSLNKQRITDNINIFDFELSPQEMKKIDALDQKEKGRIFDFSFLGLPRTHPNYPFNEYP